jgi:class 3 adenylate cyclase
VAEQLAHDPWVGAASKCVVYEWRRAWGWSGSVPDGPRPGRSVTDRLEPHDRVGLHGPSAGTFRAVGQLGSAARYASIPSDPGRRRERIPAVRVPSGTVTFLFTDIEGSTGLWESAPDAMRAALVRHDVMVRQAIESHGGYVFATGGDGFAAAFARARDATDAALEAQASMAAERWPEGAPLRVRMGLYTGETEERGGDYFGPAVNRAARLMALGHGGQIVCASATAELLDGVELADLGEHRLRDLSAPQRVFQLGGGWFPPLRSVDAYPGNLPALLTSFIGRDDELALVAKALGSSRLVTQVREA